MAPFSFYWHDYETFGVVPRRDRPAQFAGVRTDADLNEIEAPLTLYLPAGGRHAAGTRGLPDHRDHAAVVPAAWRRRTRLRRRHRGPACAPGHGRLRLQQPALRRRGHALPVLAQPDRPLRPRVAERMRPLGPARHRALRLGVAARRHPVADARRRQAVIQARAPDAGQRLGARGGPRRTVGRPCNARAGPAGQGPPAQAVGPLPEAAPQAGGDRRDGRRPAVPALVGTLPRRARLHGGGVAFGAAPVLQERGHRLGSGARSQRAVRAQRQGHPRAAVHERRCAASRDRQGCRSRRSTSTSRRS